MDLTAQKTGDWTDVTVWPFSVLPTAADDVTLNGRTVTVNTNAAVAKSVNNTGGGQLKMNDGSAIVAENFICVPTTSLITLTSSSVSCTITGNMSSSGGTILMCSNAAGYTVTVNGNVTGPPSNTYYGVNVNGIGTTIINGNLTPGLGRALYANTASTIVVTGIIKGGIFTANTSYTIAVAASTTLTLHGGLHLSRTSAGKTFFPISGPFFLDFGDGSLAQFALYDANGDLQILGATEPPPNTHALTGTARFSDQAIATLARAFRRDTGAWVGDAVPNPSTGAFNIPCVNTPHDVTISKTGYRPLTHGPINPV